MNKYKNRLLLTLALISLGLLGSYLYPRYPHIFSQPVLNTVLHVSCPNLQQACHFQVEQRSYVLQAEQAISGVRPFTLKLTGEAKSVQGSWQMQGMEMGPNEYRFIAQQSGVWQAKMALPLCTETRHDWLLRLKIDQVVVQISTSDKLASR